MVTRPAPEWQAVPPGGPRKDPGTHGIGHGDWQGSAIDVYGGSMYLNVYQCLYNNQLILAIYIYMCVCVENVYGVYMFLCLYYVNYTYID